MTANELAEARFRLGLNIQQMAGAMGVHRQTWTKWERGEQKAPAVAIRLIQALQFLFECQRLSAFLERKQGT